MGRLRSALPEAFRGHLRSARELGRQRKAENGRPPLPTSLAPLDRLLDGGLPRGRLVELVGRRSSGRFSAVLKALAAATAAGEGAALVDLGDALDPRDAEAAGVDLRRLLWLRPRRLGEALAAAEMLLAGGFPVVAVDLGPPPVAGGRGVEAAWLRLARLARERDAALLVASPYRVSGTGAATVLEAGAARAAWGGGRRAPLLAGLDARLTRQKHRGCAAGESDVLTLRLGSPWAEAEGAAEAPSPVSREAGGGSRRDEEPRERLLRAVG